jgi:hypothetical protein
VGAQSFRIPKLNPSPPELIEIPPAGTLTSISYGAAVLAPAEWLEDLNTTGLKPGELGPLLEALRQQNEAGHMVSVIKKRSGIDNTLFVSTKGNSRHAARLNIAIDPPNSLNESAAKTSMALHDFSTVGEYVPRQLFEQVKTFIELNRAVLLDYWDAKIDTETMLEQLKPVPSKAAR